MYRWHIASDGSSERRNARAVVTLSDCRNDSPSTASTSAGALSRGLPVNLRRRSARRTRTVDSRVSGRKKKRTRKVAPESQSSSRKGHRQFSAWAAKEPTTGARVGAETAPMAGGRDDLQSVLDARAHECQVLKQELLTPCADSHGKVLGRKDVSHASTTGG